MAPAFAKGFVAASCPWRIEYEGALYHVFSGGNNQQDIFLTDDDRHLFLDTIFKAATYFRAALKASWFKKIQPP